MNSEKMDNCSKDLISSLPEALICHILSSLSTKEAVQTSVLSKKWRYLFAFVPKLDLYHWERHNEIPKTFMDFVDRVLALQGNLCVNKVKLDCGDGVDPASLTRWILNVLKRGVSTLDIFITWQCFHGDYVIHTKSFVSKTLTTLSIRGNGRCLNFDVEDVFLPNLKTLYLHSVVFGDGDDFFSKLIPGCQVLEELRLNDVHSDTLSCSIFSKTLKILYLGFIDFGRKPGSVSFDTPNLVCLEYTGHVADRFPKMNVGSLVEADICLRATFVFHGNILDFVRNGTKFLMGISNVQTLHISVNTHVFLSLCRESIPLFNNLSRLTIDTDRERREGWESLSALLKNCPNLETLVFKGLYHKRTSNCQEGCLCKSSKEIPICLSTSPVKVLIIKRFGENIHYTDMKEPMDHVKHFMETMPNLEQIILDCDTTFEEDVTELSGKLQTLLKASPKCSIQVSSRLSTSGFSFRNYSRKFGFLQD